MNINALKPRLDTYIKFAKQYPAAYRAAIVSHLLTQDMAAAGTAASASVATPRANGAQTDAPAAMEPVLLADSPAHEAIGVDYAAVTANIARELGVPEIEVRRTIKFDAAGRPDIRLRIEEDSTAKKQLAYSVIYLYAAEQTGTEGANSKELRELCEKNRAFNSPNFTRNFKGSPFVKGIGTPGARDQPWILTFAGRAEARRLLSHLLGGDGRATDAPRPEATAE
jgi:hypothetical protein